MILHSYRRSGDTETSRFSWSENSNQGRDRRSWSFCRTKRHANWPSGRRIMLLEKHFVRLRRLWPSSAKIGPRS